MDLFHSSATFFFSHEQQDNFVVRNYRRKRIQALRLCYPYRKNTFTISYLHGKIALDYPALRYII